MKPKKVEKLNEEPKFDDVRRWFDENLDAEHCDLDDQEVYENVYHAGKFANVFQFTERGAQKFAAKAKPRSIIDIAAITSIYRPGPLAANVDKAFVADKEKVEEGGELEYEHPIIEDVLKSSYGHLVFQEDVMKIGAELGKLSWDDCDKLRKILVKKSIGTDVNVEKARQADEIKLKFVQGATENGMEPEQIEDLWKRMQYFSGYAFNKSVTDLCELNIYTREGVFSARKVVSRVEPGEYIQSRDEQTNEDIFVEVKAVHDHGVLNVFEYTFEDGSSVTCTPGHKFRTADGRMLPIRQILEEGLDVVGN